MSIRFIIFLHISICGVSIFLFGIFSIFTAHLAASLLPAQRVPSISILWSTHIYTVHICIYSILYTHSVCSLHTMESIEMLPCGSNCSAGIDTLIKTNKQTQLKIFKICLPCFFASAEEQPGTKKLKRKLTNDQNMCTKEITLSLNTS